MAQYFDPCGVVVLWMICAVLAAHAAVDEDELGILAVFFGECFLKSAGRVRGVAHADGEEDDLAFGIGLAVGVEGQHGLGELEALAGFVSLGAFVRPVGIEAALEALVLLRAHFVQGNQRGQIDLGQRRQRLFAGGVGQANAEEVIFAVLRLDLEHHVGAGLEALKFFLEASPASEIL